MPEEPLPVEVLSAVGAFTLLPVPVEAGAVSVCAIAGAAASIATVQTACSNRAFAIVRSFLKVARSVLEPRSCRDNDVVVRALPCHHFMVRSRHLVVEASEPMRPQGTLGSGLTILVPPLSSGGLGSCTRSKTKEPPSLAAVVSFYSSHRKSAEEGTAVCSILSYEALMQRNFGYDVITAPAPSDTS